MSAEWIYHIAPRSEIESGVRDGAYRPARFGDDGFVHCAAGRETVLAVARDYYTNVAEPVMLLQIATNRLSVPWRFEAPAPIAGGGTVHLDSAAEFPHIYGSVNLDAIDGIAEIGPGDGSFRWPAGFAALDVLLRSPQPPSS